MTKFEHISFGFTSSGSSKRICEVDDENCLDYCLPVYRGTGDIVQVFELKNEVLILAVVNFSMLF